MLGCKHRKGVVKYIHLPRQGQTLNQLQDFSFCIRHEYLRIMNYSTTIRKFLLKKWE